MEPAFMVRSLQRTGFIVNVVNAVPAGLNNGEFAVVASEVFTGINPVERL